eukprot:515614-Pleurochrysis_carterae.AAC.2
MQPTLLRAMAAIATAAGMSMRRWDFVAAYLQGDLEQNEVVYCHATLATPRLEPTDTPMFARLLNRSTGWHRPAGADGSDHSSLGSSNLDSSSVDRIHVCSL